MKLLARGVNPASLADIDLDQFSSDDDSRYKKMIRIEIFIVSRVLVMMLDQIHQLMMVYQNIWKLLQQLKLITRNHSSI
jgi:hypothetical protein